MTRYYRDPAQRKIVKLTAEKAELAKQNKHLSEALAALEPVLARKHSLRDDLITTIDQITKDNAHLHVTRGRLAEQNKKQQALITQLTYLSVFSLGSLAFLLIVMFGAQ